MRASPPFPRRAQGMTPAWAQGAYLVSVLHALKYPANSVNGVLLGCFDKDGTVQVQRALPLLHSHLALAPMMDAGTGVHRRGCSYSSGTRRRACVDAAVAFRRSSQLLAPNDALPAAPEARERECALCNTGADIAGGRSVCAHRRALPNRRCENRGLLPRQLKSPAQTAKRGRQTHRR
jgi:hypothetical protein